MVEDIFKAATVEREETFEEIMLRVEKQARSDDVSMKCSNCDFEASDREDYYNHIVNNHLTTDESDESKAINVEEEIYSKVEDKDEDDEEGDFVERILDSVLNKAVDVAAKRAEWEERLKNIPRNRNPNLLFSTLGSSQEPVDDDEDDEENRESENEDEEDEEDSNGEESEEVEKQDASSGLDSFEVLKEQERYLLDNIVKDLVELESLDIDIVGGRAGLKVKEEMNIKEEVEDLWGENVTDFQDQYQIFAENLINPVEKTEKKSSKRKKLKAMSKKKKKMKRMKKTMDEEDEENGLLATSSEVLRGLLASPANSIGR